MLKSSFALSRILGKNERAGFSVGITLSRCAAWGCSRLGCPVDRKKGIHLSQRGVLLSLFDVSMHGLTPIIIEYL